MPFYDRIHAQLQKCRKEGYYRELPLVTFNQDRILVDSDPCIDLSSNDYLGIARDPDFFRTFLDTFTDTEGSGSEYAEYLLLSSVRMGSTGSRLITGNQTPYAYCEDLLASLYNGSVACLCDTHKSDPAKAQQEIAYLFADDLASAPDMPMVEGDSFTANTSLEPALVSSGGSGDLASHAPHGAHTQHAHQPQHTRLMHHGAGEVSASSPQQQGRWRGEPANTAEDAPQPTLTTSQSGFSGGAASGEARGLEVPLAPEPELRHTRKCLYFNSGYGANVGVISTLFSKHDLLLVDRLSHASLIDGMMQSKAKALRYAHNDMGHLEALIEKNYKHYDNVVIITEAIFSVDGDFAALSEIVSLKARYPNVLIYVDDSHGFGLYGEDGLGLCTEFNVVEHVDFLVAALSKAIGSQGAFLLCAAEVKDYLVNFMRPLIFSTALPPINVTFSMYVVGLLKTSAMQNKREYVHKISSYLHTNLLEIGIKPSQSHIQPLLTANSDKALLAARSLRREGVLAMPLRYPTVPHKQARLRLALSSNVRMNDVDHIIRIIKHYRHLFECSSD